MNRHHFLKKIAVINAAYFIPSFNRFTLFAQQSGYYYQAQTEYLYNWRFQKKQAVSISRDMNDETSTPTNGAFGYVYTENLTVGTSASATVRWTKLIDPPGPTNLPFQWDASIRLTTSTIFDSAWHSLTVNLQTTSCVEYYDNSWLGVGDPAVSVLTGGARSASIDADTGEVSYIGNPILLGDSGAAAATSSITYSECMATVTMTVNPTAVGLPNPVGGAAQSATVTETSYLKLDTGIRKYKRIRAYRTQGEAPYPLWTPVPVAERGDYVLGE
jgi:hypothetical protein